MRAVTLSLLVLGVLQLEHIGAFFRGRPVFGSPALARRAAGPRSKVVSLAADDDEPLDPDAERLEAGRRRMEEIFSQNVTVDTSAAAISATERLLAQLFPSSQIIGGKLPTRFIFVDELTCIGCTHCKHVAPKTFMLEDDYGRARVFSQAGDDQEMIDEAIDCCPVECIHTVSHTELVRLEGYRAEKGDALQSKYWKSRYVGSEIGVPNVPNWWTPLLDSSQPAWMPLAGPTSMSALGFLGPMASTEKVELDVWGNPATPEPTSKAAELDECVADVEVCDLVDCADARMADLAAQLERALLLDGTELCDVTDCGDIPRDCRDDGDAPEEEEGDGSPK